MTSTAAPICGACTRTVDMETCEAFPEGIPQAILDNEVDHRRPVEGDSGLTFVQDPNKPELPAEAFDSVIFNKEKNNG